MGLLVTFRRRRYPPGQRTFEISHPFPFQMKRLGWKCSDDISSRLLHNKVKNISNGMSLSCVLKPKAIRVSSPAAAFLHNRISSSSSSICCWCIHFSINLDEIRNLFKFIRENPKQNFSLKSVQKINDWIKKFGNHRTSSDTFRSTLNQIALLIDLSFLSVFTNRAAELWGWNHLPLLLISQNWSIILLFRWSKYPRAVHNGEIKL